MAIIRTKRTKNFTVLNNDLIRDSRLSYKARGLLQYMLSMPDDWKFYVSELAKHSSKEGESAIKTGLEELEELGYMRRIQRRESNGKFGAVDWEVLDEPAFSPEVDYPLAEKPTAEKPLADNRPLLRTNSTKNLYNKELKMIDRQIDGISRVTEFKEFWEKNLGMMSPVTLQDFAYEYWDWVDKGVDHDEIIKIFIKALSGAIDYGANNKRKYTLGILHNWFNKNILSINAIEGEEKQFKAKKQQRRQNNSYTNAKPAIERDLSNKHYGTDEELEAEFFGEA